MELREPEPVGLLDDHDRRIRDVHADLDHGRRDEDVELAGLEARHHAPPLRRTEPSVQAADAVAAQLGGAEALGLLLGGTRNSGLRRLDQWTHDVRLPSFVEVAAQSRVRLGASIVRDPGRDDPLAVGRRQRELGDVEVSVDRERQRPRYRRRGQVEDVRAAPLDERRSLRDAEAMLLVDHGDGEIGEVDLLLDERVRADDDLRVPRCDELAGGCMLLRAERAREERHAHSERRAQLVDRQEVLLRERLGRRHERSLTPDLDRAEERVQRDDRLARPHVALQETLHGNVAVEIRVDLGHRSFLVCGERERKRLAVASR